ncbi:MAG TPA: AtpZ/AtpI family protein [Jatrophihabitantaceae bacterium]|nr:AtpZ/AtpI family protein [Jatrophihabitantaceae bacterium]
MIVPRETPGWSTLLGIGSASAALMAAGVLLGWWLDGVLGTSPVLLLVGIALGIAGGICYTAVQIRPFLKE